MILTVQSCGNGKYRLAINAQDSKNIFKTRGFKVKLILVEKSVVETKTTCGPPVLLILGKKYKKGFDLYHRDIDKWIKLNRFHCYEKGKPTKLEFQRIKSNSKITLQYLGNTINNNCKCDN